MTNIEANKGEVQGGGNLGELTPQDAERMMNMAADLNLDIETIENESVKPGLEGSGLVEVELPTDEMPPMDMAA